MQAELPRVVYRLATTNEQIEQVAELWACVYGEELGWLENRSSVTDQYHPHSTYVVAYVAEESDHTMQPVGTLRLVTSSPVGLPVEQFINLPSSIKAMQPIEIQRLMILPKYRARRISSGAPFGISFGMIKTCIHLCFMRGYSHYLVDSFIGNSLTQIDTYKLIGFEELGAPFRDTELAAPYLSVALFLDSVRLASCIYGNNGRLHRYLRSDDKSLEIYGESRLKRPSSEFDAPNQFARPTQLQD